ncbi:hypothetical protein [Actinosynnema sp. NPDC020468]
MTRTQVDEQLTTRRAGSQVVARGPFGQNFAHQLHYSRFTDLRQ